MAIQPIDLQAIFAQVDKVAQAQLAQREGLAIQQAVQGVQIQKKAAEQAKAVGEARDIDGIEKIGEGESGGGDRGGPGGGTPKNSEEEVAETEDRVFKDPALGKNLDLSF